MKKGQKKTLVPDSRITELSDCITKQCRALEGHVKKLRTLAIAIRDESKQYVRIDGTGRSG